jgi:tRNA pseudouridine55 synthase
MIKLDGVLLLNKPQGISSNLALQKVKRLFGAKKAGHTGTLDPLATGLLPICLGEATKFSSYGIDAPKEYIATIQLGITTSTYDVEGEVLTQTKVDISKDQILEVLNGFIGQISQIPPIYSAIKLNGKALYKYARENIEVDIAPRIVTIESIEFLEFLANDTYSTYLNSGLGEGAKKRTTCTQKYIRSEFSTHDNVQDSKTKSIFVIKVRSSKGTYIRSLAFDIGQKLGCGATLKALKRTEVLNLCLDEKITLEYLANLSSDERLNLLLPIDTFILELPKIELNQEEMIQVKFGRSFKFHQTLLNCAKIRLYCQENFLGIASVVDNLVTPIRLLNFA